MTNIHLENKLRLIREGVIDFNTDEADVNITPLTIQETLNGIKDLHLEFLTESSSGKTGVRERLRKFARWVMDRVIAFIEGVRNLFRSRKSLYTRIILRNKSVILNYTGDLKVSMRSHLLNPRMNLESLADHVKTMITTCRKMIVVDSKYDGIDKDRLIDRLITDVFHVDNYSKTMDLNTIIPSVYGKPEVIFVADIDRKRLLDKLIKFEQVEYRFTNMYNTLRNALNGMLREIQLQDEDGNVDALMAATVNLAEATTVAVDVAAGITFAGYDSINKICEYIIKEHNKNKV